MAVLTHGTISIRIRAERALLNLPLNRSHGKTQCCGSSLSMNKSNLGSIVDIKSLVIGISKT